jgi:hypothetical protein
MSSREKRISSCNNFHYSLDDNDTEEYNPGCDKIFDVPQVAGLDKARLYELYNNEKTHQAKDKEDFKIDPSCEDQAGRNYREPCSEGDNGYLLFSHRHSCCTYMFIIPEFTVSVPEHGNRDLKGQNRDKTTYETQCLVYGFFVQFIYITDHIYTRTADTNERGHNTFNNFRISTISRNSTIIHYVVDVESQFSWVSFPDKQR